VRIYVESNFVLELALEQEECVACEELLAIAEQGTIELAIPALAMFEPHRSIGARKERQRLQEELFRELKQIERACVQAGGRRAPEGRTRRAERRGGEAQARVTEDTLWRSSFLRAYGTRRGALQHASSAMAAIHRLKFSHEMTTSVITS